MKFHVCQTCTAAFVRPHNPNRHYAFCSYKCRGVAARKARLETNCGECQAPFALWPYEVRDSRRFCSTNCANRNKNHGKTDEARRVRSSAAYANWRRTVFRRDDFTCQECGSRGGKLHADHIKRFSDHPELRLDASNGRTLCAPCHLATETFGNRKAARQLEEAA